MNGPELHSLSRCIRILGWEYEKRSPWLPGVCRDVVFLFVILCGVSPMCHLERGPARQFHHALRRAGCQADWNIFWYAYCSGHLYATTHGGGLVVSGKPDLECN